MYGIKDRSTGSIVTTTDSDQSEFGGPWADPKQFEFVPNYSPPIIVADEIRRLSDSVDREATRRTALLNDSVRSRGKQLVSVAKAIRLLRKESKGQASVAEKAVLDGLEQISVASEDIDTARDNLIASLDGMTAFQLKTLDVTDNQYWP